MPEKPARKPPNNSSRGSETDWERIGKLRDEGLDTSDIPEPTPEQFARALARRGLKPLPRKQQVTLRVDADVLSWFKAQGPGYQSRINRLLREYMEAVRSGGK